MLSLAMILMREMTAAVRLAGGAFAFLEHAVDAVAHLQAVLERLDVDVRSTQLDRALDDQVDQADDRRFRCQVAQVLDVLQVAAALAFRGLDDRAHRAAALAVPALDEVVDLRTQRHQRAHVALSSQAHGVEDVGVLWIGHQHVDAALGSRRPGRRGTAS